MFTVGVGCAGLLRGARGCLWDHPQPSLSPLCWQEAEVAVGPSHVEALKGSPLPVLPVPSAAGLPRLGIWDLIKVHESHGDFCIPGGRATNRSQAGDPRHELPAVPIL